MNHNCESYNFTVFQIADYFLSQERKQKDQDITHLKLQKLIYYAQGFVLAFTHQPLFLESLEAWRHGPVCRALYDKYKKWSYHSIPLKQSQISLNEIKRYPEIEEILQLIWQIFGTLSGTQLEEMTHAEMPWKIAIKRGLNTPISNESLYYFFSNLIFDENKQGD